VLYRKDLEKENLFPYLVGLCKEFYQRKSEEQTALPAAGWLDVKAAVRTVHSQCSHCLTLYDEQYGDPEQAVAPGTSFKNLPPEYVCPVCGAPLTDFRALEKTIVPL
jgi:rubredoxin